MNKEAIATAASKVTYGGAGSTVIFGLTLNEIGVIVGIIVAVLGFIVNTVFKWLDRKDKLAHHQRLEQNK